MYGFSPISWTHTTSTIPPNMSNGPSKHMTRFDVQYITMHIFKLKEKKTDYVAHQFKFSFKGVTFQESGRCAYA
jgi:hypothetical protein